MSALKLVELIEQQDLLPASMIAQLRSQIQQNQGISPEQVAKKLVVKGLLTEFQATKVLGQLAAPTTPVEENLLELDDSEEEISPENDDVAIVDEYAIVEDEELHLVEDSIDLDDDPLMIDDDGAVLVDDDAVIVDDDVAIIEDSAEAIDIDGTPPPTPSAISLSKAPPSAPAAASVTADSGDAILGESLDIDEAEAGMGTTLPSRPKGLFGGLIGGERKKRANQWDSPLLLIGGGALLVLIILLVGLISLLRFDSGDDLFKQAEDHYRSASYSQAIAGYSDFLKRFPKHPNASEARVRQRLAKIRQFTDISKDWPGALQASEQLLPEIKSEGEAFETAQNDIASILPTVLEGFATAATETADIGKKRTLVDGSERALSLVTNPDYIPSSLRKTQQARIDKSIEALEMVKWTINRDAELESATQKIALSIDAAKLMDAYAAREELLSKYPNLADDERLVDAMGKLAEAESQQIAPVASLPQVSTEDHATASRFKVLLSNRTGTRASLDGQVAYVLVRGAAYALDAATGEVIWRRYVGGHSTVHPVAVGPLEGSDALVVDATRNELLRLESRTGKLVWRLACPGKIMQPRILSRQRALISCGLDETAQLFLVNLDDGDVAGGVSLPRQISSPPAVDVDGKLAFQAADESSLYVLKLPDLTPVATVSLDHGPGSVLVPPLPVGGGLLVAENSGTDHCDLRFIDGTTAAGEDQVRWRSVGQRMQLVGHVSSPMFVDGRRAIIVTDRGAVHVLEVDANQAEVIKTVAKIEATRTDPQVSFAWFENNQLWVADRQLTRYELQLSRGRLVRKTPQDQRDRFVSPIEGFGSYLINTRRQRNSAAITVSAIDTRLANGNHVWQTTLAAPSVGGVLVDRNRILVTDTDGRLFGFGAAELRSGRVTEAAFQLNSPKIRLSHRVDVGQRTVFYNDAARDALVVANPSAPALALLPLQLAGNSTSPPVPFADGILIPTDAGTVEFTDPATGRPLGRPFQPPLSVDEPINWVGPAVINESDQFVIADQTGRRYKVAIAEQPKLHLQSLTQQESARSFTRNLAATSDTIYAIAHEAAADVIVAMDVSDLSESNDWPVDGRVDWGPVQVGNVVLVATSSDQLFCFGAGAKLVWKSSTPAGGVSGHAIPIDDDVLLTAKQGSVVRISLNDGSQVGRVDVGEPLGSGPTLYGKQVLVVGHDGTVHVVSQPSE